MNIQCSLPSQTLLLAILWFFFMIVGFAFQFIALPVFMPDLHHGSGLIRGGDWTWFHEIAVAKSEMIALKGWGAWELQPEQQFMGGLLSALYSLTGYQDGRAYLPLLSLAYALVLVCVIDIANHIASEKLRRSGLYLLAVLPWLIFPSTMIFYSQPHKDVFFILGTIFIINSLVVHLSQQGWKQSFICYGKFILGIILVLLVRPYFLTVMIASLLCAAPFLAAYIFSNKSIGFTNLAVLLLLAFVVIRFDFSQFDQSVSSQTVMYSSPQEQDYKGPHKGATQDSFVKKASDSSSSIHFLDRLAWRLTEIRESWIVGYPKAKSNIDADQVFEDFFSVLTYQPRALFIGLFAPFPTMWFEAAQQEGGKMMRLLNGAEMFGFYMITLSLIVSFRSAANLIPLPKKLQIVAVLVFVSAALAIITTAIPNMGTVVRIRAIFWLSCLSIFILIVLEHLTRRKI